MPFELRNSNDQSILHSNNLTAKDFEENSYQGNLDGNMKLSFPFGELYLQQYVINGIRIAYSDYHLNDYIEMDWKGDLEMITMYFNLKGGISIQPDTFQKPFELGNNEHNLFFGREATGKMKAQELRMKSLMVQFSKDAFFRIANEGNDALKRFGDSIAKGQTVSLSDKNLNIDLSIQNCINSILTCGYVTDLKKIFYLSKAIELLVLQAEAYNKILYPKSTVIKTDYDKDRILFARDYLVQHMSTPPTLTELSKIVGINEFKLKKGFKEIFNHTVFGYLYEVRLELAKTELLDKRKTVTDIAFDLGYSSVPHFSNAFKKKFGISPSQVK